MIHEFVLLSNFVMKHIDNTASLHQMLFSKDIGYKSTQAYFICIYISLPYYDSDVLLCAYDESKHDINEC